MTNKTICYFIPHGFNKRSGTKDFALDHADLDSHIRRSAVKPIDELHLPKVRTRTFTSLPLNPPPDPKGKGIFEDDIYRPLRPFEPFRPLPSKIRVFKMYQVFPSMIYQLAATSMVTLNANLPVEMWAIILRLLDPASLLMAVRANSYWGHVCKGDSLLRRTVREQIKVEQKELMAAVQKVVVLRKGPTKMHQAVNGRTCCVQKPGPVVPTIPKAFLPSVGDKRLHGGGPIRTRKYEPRSAPYRSLRC